MSDINYDIYATCCVSEGKILDNYGNIYFHSNENLKDILRQIPIGGARVLTVAASGDQAFHFLNEAAKDVDLIDINKLTIHFFYLRKWTILYFNQFYPDTSMSKEYLVDLLSYIDVTHLNSREKESYLYWKAYIYNYEAISSSNFNGSLYNFSTNPNKNLITDLSYLRDRLKKYNPIFYNQNLSCENDISKKYDIVFTSNIADYIYHDYDTFKKYAKNLYNLLDDNGGLVVCANVLREKPSIIEKDIFADYFDEYRLKSKNNSNDSFSPGTVYVKKNVGVNKK